MTYQIIIHPDKFPDGYGQANRVWVAGEQDHQFRVVKQAEDTIDAKDWLIVTSNETLWYEKLFRQVRIKLTNEGVYNSRMTRILKKLRCQQYPTNYECALTETAE
jgi:hypothetical protein